MNRTDRLLAIVLELQAKGWQRAEDLSQTFEISKRTIYRDMQALSESGVPVIASPGQGFALMDGYFLPPLSLTTEEAISLILGSDWVIQTFDADYQRAAGSANSKIKAILPERMRGEVDDLRQSLLLVSLDGFDKQDLLRQIRSAVIQKRQIHFRYYARSRDGDASHRTVDPYGLVRVNQAWFLTAYCHMRQDLRNFRLDRIEQLTFTGQSFERPADFTLAQTQPTDRAVKIIVLFKQSVMRWVQEQPNFFQINACPHEDDWLVELRVRHEDEVFQWLLSWGANARVLEPESLQKRILNESKRVLETYESLLP